MTKYSLLLKYEKKTLNYQFIISLIEKRMNSSNWFNRQLLAINLNYYNVEFNFTVSDFLNFFRKNCPKDKIDICTNKLSRFKKNEQ